MSRESAPASRDWVGPDHVLRNRSVVGIGLGSLLSDTGHEMATAALPGLLRSIGATAAALGAIEGTADAALPASKVLGGVVRGCPRCGSPGGRCGPVGNRLERARSWN